MTITREQVADLQPGDVVELQGYPSLKDAVVSGPLWTDGETKKLCVGPFVIRHRDGTAPRQYDDDPNFTLTVVSRAPRPLYINHPRTEPVPKDVVLAPDGNGEMQVWICITYITGQEKPPHFVKPERHGMSHALPNGYPDTRMCQPFRLLVDGETGQVVP